MPQGDEGSGAGDEGPLTLPPLRPSAPRPYRYSSWATRDGPSSGKHWLEAQARSPSGNAVPRPRGQRCGPPPMWTRRRKRCSTGRLPDAIVVAQSFPGQFSEQAIERLRQLAPVARVLGLMGSWCEGEMRSGTPWPATARTYWHQWPARCARELARLAQGRSCAWALPPTASEEERLLADEDFRSPPHPLDRNLAVIHSASFEMWDWLAAACRSRRFAAVWQPAAPGVQVRGAGLGIFDATDFGPREQEA